MNIPDRFSEYHVQEEIFNGYSYDQLFLITKQSTRFLLRKLNRSISSIENELTLMNLCSQANLPTPTIRIIHTEDISTWVLQDYIEGEQAELGISFYDEKTQYKLGVQAGEIIRQIHALPLGNRYKHSSIQQSKMLRHAEEIGPLMANEPFLSVCADYIQTHIHLLDHRPCVLQHGDYHLANMIIHQGLCSVIDFNRCDIGDPYEEFVRAFYFSRDKSIPFVLGQLYGYFGSTLPDDFFCILKVYLADACLSAILWSMKHYPENVEEMRRFNSQIQQDFDEFKKDEPIWIHLTNRTK